MKKALSLVLALCMVFALCACGNSSSTSAAPAAAAPAADAPAAAAPAASAGAIKVGSIGPVTGPAAIYGQAVENGAALAVEEINALGGLQFEFNFQDDAHDAETSVNAYGTLVDWGMQVLVGPTTTTPSAAVAAEAEADEIFMLTPSASGPSVVEGTSNVFQMCFSDPNQGIASADYIAANNLSDAVAVIYNNGDAYSTGIYEKFNSEAAAKGINVVYVGTFTDSSQTDFSTQITAAQKAGATMFFLPTYYTPISLIMAQAKSMNYEVSYFGVDGMDGILTLEGFDTSLAEGAYLLTPFSVDAPDAKTQNFVKAFEAKYGETPNQFAADAYDCVYAVYEACVANNVTADMSSSEICEILVDAFTGSFSFTGVTGSNMTWSKGGEVSKDPMAVIIQNGEYVLAK